MNEEKEKLNRIAGIVHAWKELNVHQVDLCISEDQLKLATKVALDHIQKILNGDDITE